MRDCNFKTSTLSPKKLPRASLIHLLPYFIHKYGERSTHLWGDNETMHLSKLSCWEEGRGAGVPGWFNRIYPPITEALHCFGGISTNFQRRFKMILLTTQKCSLVGHLNKKSHFYQMPGLCPASPLLLNIDRSTTIKSNQRNKRINAVATITPCSDFTDLTQTVKTLLLNLTLTYMIWISCKAYIVAHIDFESFGTRSELVKKITIEQTALSFATETPN